MTNGQLAYKIIEELQPLYGEREARALQRYLFTSLGNKSLLDWLMIENESVNEVFKTQILQALDDLKNFKPVQYISGEVEFCNLKFDVTPDVLIPRPETEELINIIVNRSDPNAGYNILDIGTGSGIIAISLAVKLANSVVHALDISKEALSVASGNSIKNNVNVEFINFDILNYYNYRPDSQNVHHSEGKYLDSNLLYDIIVSNPPYVKESEKSIMSQNVLRYEPPIALFVPDNEPLLFYSAIINFAKKHLTSYGMLYFEINEKEDGNFKSLLEYRGFGDVEIYTDFNDKPRFISAKKLM
jgi:release factor glutamine methyltransferase